MTATVAPPSELAPSAAEAPDLKPQLDAIEQSLADLSVAIVALKRSCWGPGDQPLAALPQAWYQEITQQLSACAAELLNTPTPDAVACGGDYARQ